MLIFRILLMISNAEGWHYIAVTNLPSWVRGITSKHLGNFYYSHFRFNYSNVQIILLEQKKKKIT